ncbi:hypothetical protein FQR65_LT01039 [Abscondita terminalis]|nr:hypothetical protein FQR65_LT01039 [Abscondita terminalis]
MFDLESTLLYVFNDYNYLTDGVENPQIKINIKNPIFGKQKLQKCNYIFQCKNLTVLRQTINLIASQAMWNPNEAKRSEFIFIIEEGNLSNIFTLLWGNRIINFIVIFVNRGGTKILISNPLVPQNQCGKKFNTYKEQSCFDVTPITFQKTIINYNKCLVIFAKLIPKEFRTIKSKYHDTIHLIMDLVKTVLNASVIQVYTNEQSYGKDTAHGIGVYEHFYGYDADGSNIFFFDDFVWIGSEPPERALLKTFFSAFRTEVWIMIFVVLISIIIVWCFIEAYTKRGCFTHENCFEICSYGISLMFAVSISKIPNVISLKLLLTSYLIYILHIHTAYTSDIVNDLVVPKFEGLIKSVEELADSDIPIILNEQGDNYFEGNYKNFTLFNKIINKIVRVTEYSPKMYESYKRNDKFRSHFFSTEITGSFRSVFRCTRGHYFIPSINKVITLITESGLQRTVYDEKKPTNTSIRVINITYYEQEHTKWSNHWD